MTIAGKLADRVAIITGGGQGIGRGIALRFAQEGASVVIADHQRDQAEQTAAAISASGGEALVCVTDVADKDQVDNMLATAVQRFGRIDILVNNAAIALLYEPFFEISQTSWQRMIDVNLTGVFWCSQGAARSMRAQQRGWIINIASVNSFRPEADVAHYAASKGGVLLLTRAMARDLAPYGISVNAIAPGAIRTERTDVFDSDPAHSATVAQMREAIPVHRRGETDEIAAACVFLASDEARYVQGHTLVVDGGLLLV